MKIIISPAKSLDFESKATTSLYTQPSFLEDSVKLNKKLKSLSRNKLGDLMKISPALAALNYDRNQNWQPPFSLDNAKQAVYAFTGEVFRGLDVTTLTEEKISLLQDRLRILSGLYGLLRPLDLIQPYRLEMGTRITIRLVGKDLVDLAKRLDLSGPRRVGTPDGVMDNCSDINLFMSHVARW